MPDGYSPAKPFSNGSEAEFFDENFCQRCTKRKYGEDGLPLPRNCRTEAAIGNGYIDTRYWPRDGNIVVDPKGRTVCLDFFSEYPEIMAAYEKEFPQTYVGCTLHNLADGYLAKNPDGTPALRCGTRENLERILLVIHADKVQCKFV